MKAELYKTAVTYTSTIKIMNNIKMLTNQFLKKILNLFNDNLNNAPIKVTLFEFCHDIWTVS